MDFSGSGAVNWSFEAAAGPVPLALASILTGKPRVPNATCVRHASLLPAWSL